MVGVEVLVRLSVLSVEEDMLYCCSFGLPVEGRTQVVFVEVD